MSKAEFCYGCKYLHSEEIGDGNPGGRWRCTKAGHSYVVVGMFGFMAEDIEGDKPRPINECYVKRNGAPPERHVHRPACPWPKPDPKTTEELLEPSRVQVRVTDPLEACTS